MLLSSNALQLQNHVEDAD